MPAKSPKKNKRQTKLQALLSNKRTKPVLFVLAFALIGTGLILATRADTFDNPATTTYNVDVSKTTCTVTKQSACYPTASGTSLSAPNSTVEYTISGVGPGRYNLNVGYSIPQIIGVYDYGYINYDVTGNLVNINGPIAGQRHIVLDGNTPSSSTAPLTAFGTFTSLGVKWPGGDLHVKINYTNSIGTTFTLTSMQLQPQKSRSGWVCNVNTCTPSPDYAYYFAPGSAPGVQSASSGATAAKQTTSSSSPSASPAGATPAPTVTTDKLTPGQTQQLGTKEQKAQAKNSDNAQPNHNECGGGNIFQRTYCRTRSAVRSLFSHF